MSAKVWKIQSSEEHNNKLQNYIQKLGGSKTMLLDLNKTKYNFLEKFIYETAMFHFKKLNIIDSENKYVEFWCKTKFNNHNFHVDCDEYERRTNNKYLYPLQSCVSYFTDSKCPTIITNIDMDGCLYKEFEDQNEIFLSFPKLNNQITFDGKFFHGCTSLSEDDETQDRYIIAINLWNIKPSNIEYYLGDDEFIDTQVIASINEETNTENIIIPTLFFNRELFEKILYTYDKTVMYSFKKFINPNVYSYKFIKDSGTDKKTSLKSIESSALINDIHEIMNSNIKYNRFIQRFQYNKIYTPDMCRYIINQCEKYAAANNGWTTTRHINYPTTDLPVDIIPSIFYLILETLTEIITKIKKSYSLGEEVLFDVNDLFVVKYKHDEQKYLEIHTDVSMFSFNILLSDQKDFEGGGTYFEDGITTFLEQGDMLIHSGRTKHSGKSITKGVRYVLVGFLDIKMKE
jgi:hypothetical protein